MLAACKHRLIIPAVNMTKGSVQKFKTGHHPDFTLHPKRRLVDVVMATSAAPTYFPLAEVGAAHYADGGLVANAPDQCALHEATHFLKQDVCQISILSYGTTSTGFSLKRSLGRDLGSAKWMMRSRIENNRFLTAAARRLHAAPPTGRTLSTNRCHPLGRAAGRFGPGCC